MAAEGWQPIILEPRGSQEITAEMLDDYEILGLYDLYDVEDATDESRMAVTVIYEPIARSMTLPYAVPLLVRAKRADVEPLVTGQMGREVDALLTAATAEMTEDEAMEAFEGIHYWCSSFTGRYDVWQFAMPEKDALLSEYGALVFGAAGGEHQCFYRVAASDGYTMRPMSYCFTAYDARTFQNLPLANDRIRIVVLDPEELQTGVQEVRSEKADEFATPHSALQRRSNSYNLQGQKVSDHYRGLVIKNGRKVVIK
jgi:hypothetical protein